MGSGMRAVVAGPLPSARARTYAVTGHPPVVGPLSEVLPVLRSGEDDGVRWVVWSATEILPELVASGWRPARIWDVAEVHRLLHGGRRAGPAVAWASAHELGLDGIPGPPSEDLFAIASDPSEDVVDAAGYLRGDAVAGSWLSAPERLVLWGEAAHACAERQRAQLVRLGPRALATALSESAASALCVELESDGLPIDRGSALRLIEAAAGPRPGSPAEELRTRTRRDDAVRRHVPDGARFDLRNPASVREMLHGVGIDVPTTRKWVLGAYQEVHPVVPALLAWRADERIATTYGYTWLDAHVGPDDRLRGRWTVSDGAAGRMTAQNGLHNLPAVLRPAVAAEEGHVLVRADLGQIEPRVLAAVSGDPAFAAATRADDLYAPVAARLAVERPVAKVAVLAAMYGQRSGAAGEALRGLERAYPVAMALLDRAYAAGLRGAPVRTFGGRLVQTDFGVRDHPVGADRNLDAGRGRFARNAVIQGSAAELFKAWAATVRAALRGSQARIVLCLHDELLVHAPEAEAPQVAAALHGCLDDAARRWVGSDAVRFVADVSTIRRWSDAKP